MMSSNPKTPAKMVRQRNQRKSIEELYSNKCEVSLTTPATKSHVTSNNLKNTRGVDRVGDGGYLMSSMPYQNAVGSVPCTPHPPPVTHRERERDISGGGINTSRRKSARPPYNPHSKPDKMYGKEDKLLEELKKENKNKVGRTEKCVYTTPQTSFDNKNYINYAEVPGPISKNNDHSHSHGGHRHRHNHDDDKEDDTEEFFELIRQTVENAIGKSISDLLNRNFRELASKVDRFSAELKTTNSALGKLQTEMNNKVVHYGEENSRHFRYLCMKSEYDKMFYQHHSMMATTPNSSSADRVGMMPPPVIPPFEKPRSSASGKSSQKSDKISTAPCTSCRGSAKSGEPLKHSSDDHISNKSSELGMREVLEHIQRFCNQMQMNDIKCEDRSKNGSPVNISNSAGTFRLEDAMKINNKIFEEDDEDDDESQLSSDGMTPRSDERTMQVSSNTVQSKYGNCTMRTSRGGSNNGGGDA